MKSLPTILFFLSIISSFKVQAQLPIADFAVSSSTACSLEDLKLTNLSTGYTNIDWDFCERDLLTSPVYLDRGVISGESGSTDIRFYIDGLSWFGFVCDADGNKVSRLNFGNSLNNTPVIDKLGDFNVPAGIELAEINGVWYGLVGTYNLPSQLYLFQFGSSLGNTPQIDLVNLPTDALVSPRTIRLVQEGASLVAFLANGNQTKVTRIDFGSNLSTTVLSVDLIEMSASSLVGMDAVDDGSGKYLLVTGSASNLLFKVSFGSSWKNTGTVETVSTGAIGLSNPGLVKAEYEGGHYYAMLVEIGGRLLQIDFGSSLSGLSPNVTNLGTFMGLQNVYGMDIQRTNGGYTMLLSSHQINHLYQIDFQSTSCVSSIAYYEGETPPAVSYSTQGTYPITLRVKGLSLQKDNLTKEVVVSSTVSPSITLSKTNKECMSEDNEFSVTSSGLLTNYAWLFGDGTSSTDPSPTYRYGTPDEYTVSVEVVANNGCKNRAQEEISIYLPPSFSLPVASVLCTNQLYSFSNTTIYSEEPQWEWFLNEISQSTEKNWENSFSSTSPSMIKLLADNGECVSEVSQLFNVDSEGPEVDFTVEDGCEGKELKFNNLTSGLEMEYQWEFGEGSTSAEENPKKIYSSYGTYSVKLTATNAAGCENNSTKPVTIHSSPQPDFSLDLPPFSCSGSPSQFNDVTPHPTESNIATWLWNFGDVLNGTSGIQHAQYTYPTGGQYNVSLITTTNFGCTGTIQKQIAIQQSPLAAFTNSTACVNQSTNFVDTSTGNIKSRLWTIGGSVYTTPSVSKTFASPGSFQSQLTVTGNNNCVATVAKTIPVPVPPSLNFSMENGCSGQNAIFTDTTPIVTDPVSTRLWDFANQGNATGASAEHVFSSVGAYGVKLTVTNQSGCSYSLMKQVAITKTPTANFTPSPEDGPAPLLVKFNNASTDATSYLWQFNDATGSMSTEHSPSFTYTALGNYLVELTAISLLGCQDKFSREVNVIVPYPDLSIDEVNIIKNAATGTIKMSVSIHNKGNSIISGTSLLIDASGGSLLKENVSNTIRPGETVVYVTHAELVMREDELTYLCAEVNTSGDIDVSNNMDCLLVEDETVYFPAYPNPSQGQLFLEWIANQGASAYVLIVNSFGQKVFSAQIDATREGLNQLEFDVSNFSAGEYILTLQFEDTKKYFRFTVI